MWIHHQLYPNMKCTLFLLLSCFGTSLCFFDSTFSLIKIKCNIYGNPILEAKYEEATDNFTTCYENTITIYPDSAAIESSKKNGTLSELGKKIGDAYKTGYNCYQFIYNLGFECMPKEDMGYLRQIQKGHSELAKYFIDNNAEKLTAFLQQVNFTCYQNIHMKCLSNKSKDKNLENGIVNCNVLGGLKSCVMDSYQKQCLGSLTFIPGVLDIMKSAFCSENNVRNKRDAETSDGFLASSKYALLSLVPLRTRLIREIGGAGSKLPHIENRVKNLCNNDLKLQTELETMKTCLRAKRMFETPRDEYIQHIEDCSKETRQLLRQCLPAKFQYFPEFFFKLVESVVKLLYDDFGEIARGLSPCISKLQREESEDDYNNCVSVAGADVDDEMLASKKRFCKKFIEVSECFIKQINDTCTTNPDLEKFKTDYMAAMKRPCK